MRYARRQEITTHKRAAAHIGHSTVTACMASPQHLMLQAFNTLNHLDTDEHRSWITHA